MSPVRFSLAFFVGVFLQTLLVGLFIPLLLVASYAQWKKVSRGRKVNRVMAFATIFFGLTSIAHWVLGVHRVIQASLFLPSGVTADRFLNPPYNTEEIIRRAIFQLQVVVGDMIMVYRMYHIYDKSLLACIIPSITTTGLLVIGCGLTNQLRNLNTPAEINTSSNWSAACYCVSLFNSVFLCAAISLRLWRVHRETTVSNATQKNPVILQAIWVLVESAALWTFSVLLGFFAFLAKSNLRYTFLAMTGPVVGISFCLIIVRLGAMAPEVREDSWESSQRTRSSRTIPLSDSRLCNLPVPLDRVKVDRDVYVSDADSAVQFHMMGHAPPTEK